jgi:hypothetical protein
VQLNRPERAARAWYDSVGSNDCTKDASDSGADGGSFTLISAASTQIAPRATCAVRHRDPDSQSKPPH